MKKLTFLVLAFSLAVATAHAATVSGGTVDLPETGQATCYDAAGTVIVCAGMGQDGEIGAGAARQSARAERYDTLA